MPRACVSFSPAPNQWGTFQRKYRTRFSCAISAFLLHHQIRQPSTYIEPNDSILFQNFLFSGESNEAQEQRKSHDKRMTRRNVLCHVSRNRPHPTIYFPFQTGDRVRNKYCWKKFFIFFSLIATLNNKMHLIQHFDLLEKSAIKITERSDLYVLFGN